VRVHAMVMMRVSVRVHVIVMTIVWVMMRAIW
jgi:hypothetical protein